MAEALHTLAAIQEATRVRLSAKAVEALRDHVELYEAMAEDGDANDKLVANALGVLWAMYLKLEAIPRGQA